VAGDSLAGLVERDRATEHVLDRVVEPPEPDRHRPQQLAEIAQPADDRPRLPLDLLEPLGQVGDPTQALAVAQLALACGRRGSWRDPR